MGWNEPNGEVYFFSKTFDERIAVTDTLDDALAIAGELNALLNRLRDTMDTDTFSHEYGEDAEYFGTTHEVD